MALATIALITVAEAGAHLKLDSTQITADTTLLEGLIHAATKAAEDYTGRAFINRTITETHLGDGTTTLRLWKWPVYSISTITIDDTALLTWTERLTIGRLYTVNTWEKDAEIVLVYTAGYGTNRAVVQALVPDAVLAVKMLVAQSYENREGVKDMSITGLGSTTYDPDAWKAKLEGLKVPQC